MPRRSSAALAVIRPAADWLRTPEGLDADVAAVFKQIVASCGPDHFAPGDAHLVATYATAIAVARRLADDPAQFRRWVAASRLVAALATKLRLCPSARQDPKSARVSAERHKHKTMSYYDQMMMEQQTDGAADGAA